MRRLLILIAGAVAALVLASGAGEDGPLPPDVHAELAAATDDPSRLGPGDLEATSASGDARTAWVLVDLLRFRQSDPAAAAELEAALRSVTGADVDESAVAWVAYTDLLLAHDVPAPPGYLDLKRAVFLAYEPGWEPFFDPGADVDWREVAWGGVARDGIPALVDPVAIPLHDADFLDPDDVVFGVELDDEARAYPRRILEVHEMANDTLADRRIAFSYCTLCGAPIPYFVDGIELVGEPLELRTSGLLQRSNKLMYDVQTESMFDQFRGTAVSGPLHAAGVELERLRVTVTTWDRWRAERPESTVLDVPGRRGRDRELQHYPGDLRERRDADGPIFPIGDRDGRLEAQTVVLGVRTGRGVAVAFPVEPARERLEQGREVVAAGVALELDTGLVARPEGGGPELPAHEAFWFAWSQFRPDTELWVP